MVNPNLIRFILQFVRRYASKQLSNKKNQQKLYDSIRNNQTINDYVRKIARRYKQIQERNQLEDAKKSAEALEAARKANRANRQARANATDDIKIEIVDEKDIPRSFRNDPKSSQNSQTFRRSGDSRSADDFKSSDSTVIKGDTFWQRNWGKVAAFYVLTGLAIFIYNDSTRSVQAGSDTNRERRGSEFAKFT